MPKGVGFRLFGRKLHRKNPYSKQSDEFDALRLHCSSVVPIVKVTVCHNGQSASLLSAFGLGHVL